MAEKRMFSRKVLETDKFLSLPASTQMLYVHLSMLGADDDGFIDNVMMIMAVCKAKPDDLGRLIREGYVLQVSESVYVIAHWFLNNNIQKDRFHPTVYAEEKNTLCRPNNIWQYREGETYPLDTENRLDEDSKEKTKSSKGEKKEKHGVYQHVLLSGSDLEKLVDQFPFDYQRRINELDEYLEINPKKHYDNHYLVIVRWARKDEPKQKSFADMAEEMEGVIDL